MVEKNSSIVIDRRIAVGPSAALVRLILQDGKPGLRLHNTFNLE
jgi:hypothetical protein